MKNIEISLYRLSQTSWAIHFGRSDIEAFASIEAAADQLISIGISDEAIDEALIELAANNHTRAIFTNDGKLKSTDETRYDGGPLGLA